MNASHRGVILLPFGTGSLSFTESLSTTATEVKSGASALDQRKAVYIRNQSDVKVLWGFSSGTCYCELDIDDDIVIYAGADLTVYCKAASGSSKTIGCAELK
jgi:hypothetical protein